MGKRRKPVPSKQDAINRAQDERLTKLAESLRKQYDDIRDEPIPQSLQGLVDALRATEEQSKTRH
ncbi:MAG: hypothetical protein AAF331_13440 [Pseudomonadota bacterium]